MRLVGYIRVSTEEQKQGWGLQFQRESIEAYCRHHGHELVQVYEDAGLTGSNMNRPGLQTMLASLGEIDGLVIYSVCRLSRDRVDTQLIVDRQLWPAGKLLFGTTQQLDITTEEGRFMISVLAGINQLERATITKRTSTGRKTKAAAGGYAGGRPAYGKRKAWIIDETTGKLLEKKLTVDPTEAQIIELIKRHRRSGKAAHAIAAYLNEQGHKTKTGKAWTHVQVKRILDRVT